MSKYGYTRSTLPHGALRGVTGTSHCDNESICHLFLKINRKNSFVLIAEELERTQTFSNAPLGLLLRA